MVRFRQRFSVDKLNAINETICEQDKKDDDGPPPATGGGSENPAKTTENKGKLIMDATCVPTDIRYPTDLGLIPSICRCEVRLKSRVPTAWLPGKNIWG